MTYDEAVVEAVQRLGNSEISQEAAVAIAAAWHGGQSTYLYSFASTGVLHHSATDTWRELSDAMRYSTASRSDRTAADMFGTFLMNCAQKAEQP